MPKPEETPDTSQPTLDWILEGAESHGSIDDPDHEVGDLQDALCAAWALMNDEQRAALLAHEDVQRVLWWRGREE